MTDATVLRPPSPAGAEERNRHYLHVGQVACFARPTSITTILGSCVAVCLWDFASGVGGMNHYLLPGFPEDENATSRYGYAAFRQLLEEMKHRGAKIRQMQAKIFGGASLHGLGNGELGRANVELARTLLLELDIPIVSSDVGGKNGRKVVFQTDDGTAWLKKLANEDTSSNS